LHACKKLCFSQAWKVSLKINWKYAFEIFTKMLSEYGPWCLCSRWLLQTFSLTISPDISRFFWIVDLFSKTIFKQNGSQWEAVLHGISLGSKLFANVIKVPSVACINGDICQNLRIIYGQVMSPWTLCEMENLQRLSKVVFSFLWNNIRMHHKLV